MKGVIFWTRCCTIVVKSGGMVVDVDFTVFCGIVVACGRSLGGSVVNICGVVVVKIVGGVVDLIIG